MSNLSSEKSSSLPKFMQLTSEAGTQSLDLSESEGHRFSTKSTQKLAVSESPGSLLTKLMAKSQT